MRTKPILQVLQNDQFELPLNAGDVPKSRVFNVSRWAYIGVRQELRPTTDATKAERLYKRHGYAMVVNSEGVEYEPYQECTKEPVLAIRTYTNAEAAVINSVHYLKHGFHRCNICMDTQLQSGTIWLLGG